MKPIGAVLGPMLTATALLCGLAAAQAASEAAPADTTGPKPGDVVPDFSLSTHAGKVPDPNLTKPYGCSIKYAKN